MAHFPYKSGWVMVTTNHGFSTICCIKARWWFEWFLRDMFSKGCSIQRDIWQFEFQGYAKIAGLQSKDLSSTINWSCRSTKGCTLLVESFLLQNAGAWNNVTLFVAYLGLNYDWIVEPSSHNFHLFPIEQCTHPFYLVSIGDYTTQFRITQKGSLYCKDPY